MGNVITIKRGEGAPGKDDLAPYELGYSTTTKELYINDDTTSAGVIQIQARKWTNPLKTQVNLASSDPGSINGVGTEYDFQTTTAIGVTGILPITHGGTGLSAYSYKNAILAVNANKNGLKLVPTASGALYSTGANAAPSFGVLPVAQGGTGVAAEDRTDLAQSLISGVDISPAAIQVGENKYYTSSTTETTIYGINMNNSDIIGINGIWFNDQADDASEGIHFYRTDSTTTASKWDTLWAKDGELYLSKGCTLTAARDMTNKVFVYNTTTGGTISGPLTLTGGSDVDDDDTNNHPALIIKPSGGYQLNFDGNEILCRYADTTTEDDNGNTNDGKQRPLWINGIAVGYPAYGEAVPTDSIFDDVMNGQIYFQVVTS